MLKFGIDIYRDERAALCEQGLSFVDRDFIECLLCAEIKAAFIITLGESKATPTYLYQNSFSIWLKNGFQKPSSREEKQGFD